MFAHGGGGEGSYLHGRHSSAPENVRVSSEDYPSTTSINTKPKNEESGFPHGWPPTKLEGV